MNNNTITPSALTKSLINMGYNSELSAPLIANAYLAHKHNNEPLPKTWEKETIKDVQTCYNLLLNKAV